MSTTKTRAFLLTSVVLVATTGCDVTKLAGTSEGQTKLTGPNAAIGGLYYQSSSAPGRDWHLTACRRSASTGQLIFSANDEASLLTVQIAEPRHVVLHASQGAEVAFAAADCTTLKVDGTGEPDGRLSLVCRRGEQSLTGSVRFERCGS